MMINSSEIASNILRGARVDEFAGYDPFDGLNSRLFVFLPMLKHGIFGLAWIQFFKRAPVNLRPLLGVPKKRNPKGIALFVMGLLEDYQRYKDEACLSQAIDLGDWLLAQQSEPDQWRHSCWGYHFDWKARAFFVPKGKPNVITTVYVAQALFALAKLTGNDKYRDPALDAAHFMVDSLYTEADGRCFFAYVPGETAFVHNASLWAAAWVAVVAAETGNDVYRLLALNVARQSVAEQGDDGSWVYGARHHHQFMDGFHTGYNLEALHLLRSALGSSEFDEAIARGLVCYKQHLFEADGTAKYYHNDSYPLDMHSVSQALLTLLKVGNGDSDLQLAGKILNRAVETLYMHDKQRFVYQKHRYLTNRVNYLRWTQAWSYYSLAFYNRACGETGMVDHAKN